MSVSQGKNGFSASSTAAGFNAGTMTANGFQGADIDWLDENLDVAKEAHDKIINAKMKPAEDSLIKKYTEPPMTDDQISSLNPEAKSALLKKIGEQMPENIAAGTSRTDGVEKFFGEIRDNFVNLGRFGNEQFESNAGMMDAKGNFHPRTCFVAGTLVHTAEGLKKIEEIKIGDLVRTYDESGRKFLTGKVTELYRHNVKLLYKIILSDGSVLKTTWNHPFYVTRTGVERTAIGEQRIGASLSALLIINNNTVKSERKGSWVEAKDLHRGNSLLNSRGNPASVVSVEPLPSPDITVYNFEVEGTHNYFVGEQGVLVHNYEKKSLLAKLIMFPSERAQHNQWEKEANDNYENGYGYSTNAEREENIENDLKEKLETLPKVFKPYSAGEFWISENIRNPLKNLEDGKIETWAIWPEYGPNDIHRGDDYPAQRNDPVYSMLGGKITQKGPGGRLGNYAEVESKLPNGEVFHIKYAHNDSFPGSYRIGDTVPAGQQLGFAGDSGNAEGIHSHVSVVYRSDSNDGKMTVISKEYRRPDGSEFVISPAYFINHYAGPMLNRNTLGKRPDAISAVNDYMKPRKDPVAFFLNNPVVPDPLKSSSGNMKSVNAFKAQYPGINVNPIYGVIK